MLQIPKRTWSGARTLALGFVLWSLTVPAHAATERLCDSAFEDCRQPLLDLISAETEGIDVAFWFMEDLRYAQALIARHQAGVPIRVLVDRDANPGYPINATALELMRAAGIPMRDCVTAGILHHKMMLFAGQNTIQFSGANFSPDGFVPIVPYANYVDEAIYFTDDPSVVNSFKTHYDDLWVSESWFADYANVARPLRRRFPQYPKDPELNFVPMENFAARSLPLYRAETRGIDAIIYRITDRSHADEMINAVARGVPVRLISEQRQYRDETRYWHAWNIDRMHMAGVQIRHRAHAGMIHEKATILRAQGLTVFGSSNWTGASASSQFEHNYFTRKPFFLLWFQKSFDRKWLNLGPVPETKPFAPLPPDAPLNLTPGELPANGAALRWNPGFWGAKADIYFGESPSPPLVASNVEITPAVTASYALPPLQPGHTYYFQIVSKTMANMAAAGETRFFIAR